MFVLSGGCDLHFMMQPCISKWKTNLNTRKTQKQTLMNLKKSLSFGEKSFVSGEKAEASYPDDWRFSSALQLENSVEQNDFKIKNTKLYWLVNDNRSTDMAWRVTLYLQKYREPNSGGRGSEMANKFW